MLSWGHSSVLVQISIISSRHSVWLLQTDEWRRISLSTGCCSRPPQVCMSYLLSTEAAVYCMTRTGLVRIRRQLSKHGYAADRERRLLMSLELTLDFGKRRYFEMMGSDV
jgi:hypothetical protein